MLPNDEKTTADRGSLGGQQRFGRKVQLPGTISTPIELDAQNIERVFPANPNA